MGGEIFCFTLREQLCSGFFIALTFSCETFSLAKAAINSLFDSDEYIEAFGDHVAPYRRFKGTYPSMFEFVRTNVLESYPGTTDKALVQRAVETRAMNPNTVLSLEGAGVVPKILDFMTGEDVKKGLPRRPDLESRTAKANADLSPTAIAAIASGVVLLILLFHEIIS